MDQANKKIGNHPTASYLIGSIFIGITLVVFVGVLYHLTFSTHGPQLLIPLKKKYFTKQQSTILTEAKGRFNKSQNKKKYQREKKNLFFKKTDAESLRRMPRK